MAIVKNVYIGVKYLPESEDRNELIIIILNKIYGFCGITDMTGVDGGTPYTYHNGWKRFWRVSGKYSKDLTVRVRIRHIGWTESKTIYLSYTVSAEDFRKH